MNKFWYLIMLLPALQACEGPQHHVTQGQVIFDGTADTAYNGSKIVLRNNALNQTDTATITNGKFRFEIPFKEATRYRLYNIRNAENSDPDSPCDILVAGTGVIAVKANLKDLPSSIVNGAPDNDLYKSYTNSELKTRRQINQKLTEKYGENFSSHFEPEDPLYKKTIADYERLAHKLTVNLSDFIKRHADSYASLYVLQTKVNDINADTIEQFYNQLGGRYKKTSTALIISTKIKAEKATAIGKIAPDFEQPDTSGRAVKLSAFRGQFVLIDFWASWCGPCREENPNLLKAYRKYRNRGFSVLSVSLDRKEDKHKWLAAIHEDHLEWTQLSDLRFLKNKVALTYGVTSIPQNFLIDPKGHIVAKGLMGAALKEKLSELLPAK